MKIFDIMETPIGELRIEEENGYITKIGVLRPGLDDETIPRESGKLIERCKRELAEYFAGERTKFTIPLNPVGTSFMLHVWEELKCIKYGEVISYKELAERIGNPKAVRAVGGANSKNKLIIVIPCHRVIGANGAMTGYGGGGIHNKELLLEHEKNSLEKLCGK